jgi:tRNA pseudouridine13 synthase
LHYLGQGNQRINLGCLEGNEFEIIVESDASSGQFPRAITKTINYFDDQRFGRHKDNHVVGKLLVQRKFKEVCELLAAHDGVSHNAMSHDVSKETDHETLQSRFVVQDNNYVGALRTIPRKVLQLYVHAYQSYLWNLVVDEYVRKNFRFYEIEYGLGKLAIPFVIGDLQQIKIPIIGFGTEFPSESTYQGKYDKLGAIVDVILEKEGITLRDFVIREIPEITNEGSERDMILVVDKLKVTELNRPSWLARLFAWLLHKPPQNFRKYKLAFALGKGSYATLVVKDVFAAPIPISTNSAMNEANNDAKHDTKPAAATSKEL